MIRDKIDQQTADEVARAFLGELGGPPATEAALSRIPVRELLAAQARTVARLSDLERMMVFLPLVDHELIQSHPLDAVRRGDARDISLLTGVTLDEWRLFRMVEGGLRFTRAQLRERFQLALKSGSNGTPDPERALEQFSRALRDRGAPTSPFDVWSAFQTVRVFL